MISNRLVVVNTDCRYTDITLALMMANTDLALVLIH